MKQYVIWKDSMLEKNIREKPKVSVIMGVYNCESTLKDAVNSIVGQTYDNWEFIICDDASSDSSYELLLQYKEIYGEKFLILKNERNKGLNYTLNRCLGYAKGEYIARMDGDDISELNRFEIEVQVLDTHPEYQIVSSNMCYFDDKGIWGKSNMKTYPEREDLVKGPVFCHAPCMVRRKAYEAVGGYTVEKKLIRVEDWHLWIKMYAHGYKGFNIQETLYNMRDNRDAWKRRNFRNRLNEAYVISLAIKLFKLSVLNYIYCLRPICIGFLPQKAYSKLHKLKIKRMGYKTNDT